MTTPAGTVYKSSLVGEACLTPEIDPHRRANADASVRRGQKSPRLKERRLLKWSAVSAMFEMRP